MAMLEVKDLQVSYGMIQAIKGISFEVNQGEVIALIGANGAGKTTILHTVTGLLAPKAGSIMFEGQDITKVPAHKIVSMGMAHVPEGRRVFSQLTVLENLKMGAYTRKDKNEIAETLEKVYKHFPRLEESGNAFLGTGQGIDGGDGGLNFLQTQTVLLQDAQTPLHQLVVVRLVTGGFLQFRNTGFFCECNPDFRY